MKKSLSMLLLHPAWRWIGCPVLLAAGMAFIFSDAYPAIGQTIPPKQAVSAALGSKAAVPTKIDELSATARLSERITEIENSQKTHTAAWLEGQRKLIEWWLSFLGFMVAVLALGGALIPYLMGRKDKELLELALRQARQAADLAQGHLTSAAQHAQQATLHATTARSSAEEIEKVRNTLVVSQVDSKMGVPQGEPQTELNVAAETVRQDPNVGITDKLRADAVSRGNAGDLLAAYRLSAAVVAIEPDSSIGESNAGTWAKNLAQKLIDRERDVPGQHFWLQTAAKHYARALELNPSLTIVKKYLADVLGAEAYVFQLSKHFDQAQELWSQANENYAQALKDKTHKGTVLNGWGIALARQAQGAADAGDLPRARQLWAESAEKAGQAVAINPEHHWAISNMGAVLAQEASALAKSGNISEAELLWRRAREKFAEAIAANPQGSRAVLAWGLSLSEEANARNERGDVEAARAAWTEAIAKFEEALKVPRFAYEAAHAMGSARNMEAKSYEVEGKNSIACERFKQAGESYAKALELKPGDYGAICNLADCLIRQHHLFLMTDPETAVALRNKAKSLLLSHLTDDSAQDLGYNLGCCFAVEGDAPNAVKWFQIALKHAEGMPPIKHMETDPDLESIRKAPEFIHWFSELKKKAGFGAISDAG